MHDMEKSHGLLVSHEYKAFDLKGLDDSQDPLRRVNEVHARLKGFLYSHNSLSRDKIQGVLDLFYFVSDPSIKSLLKVDQLINLGRNTRKTLKYRVFYNISPN